jgi:hypothetical protein
MIIIGEDINIGCWMQITPPPINTNRTRMHGVGETDRHPEPTFRSFHPDHILMLNTPGLCIPGMHMHKALGLILDQRRRGGVILSGA